MSQQAVKFAYWVPNVSGGLVVSKIEQRTHWGIDYNRKLAQLAEEAGFEYALSQIRFTAGYGAEYQHESVAFSHALLAATEKLKVIAAILPGPWQPALAAKQLATIDQLTNGRVAVNIVSGWFKGEFRAIGEHWLDHDERYRRSEEFIRALKGIWTQDNFSFHGDFYRFHNYSLKPKPLGISRKSSRVAAPARRGTWLRGFRTGTSPTATPRRHQGPGRRHSHQGGANNGHSVKVGVNAFVIARETEAEARAVLRRSSTKADPEAVNAFGERGEEGGQGVSLRARATGPSRPSRTWCSTTMVSRPT